METKKVDLDVIDRVESQESIECNDYYHSYDSLDVHKLMLEDSIKNETYRDAILNNKYVFEGKVVLDVGTGTGILSIFCAQAGAKKVYAVEASDVYTIAQEIVKENNFESVIEVIHSPIETANIPEKVDIIVSEWMGFYLLHEGMIASVIIARDKFLKPGGLIFPETATLFSAPCSVPSYFDYWKDMYGVSMKHMAKKLREKLDSPITETIHPDSLLTKPDVVFWLDLHTTTLDQIANISHQALAVTTKQGNFQGVCFWFICSFPSKSSEPVILSTGPGDDSTHWKQTTLVLPDSFEVKEKCPIAYKVSFKTSETDNRKYRIELEMLEEDEIKHPERCSCYLPKCQVVTRSLHRYEVAAQAK